MNAGNQLLAVLQMECDSAVKQAISTLDSAGYLAVKSFDLHTAATIREKCTCSSEACTCQMVILLVYAREGAPSTLIFDGDGPITQVYLANDPQQTRSAWAGNLAQLLFSPPSIPTFIE